MREYQVAILSYPHVALFELACATELFGLPRPEFSSWYQCDVVTFDNQELQSTAGLLLRAKYVNNLRDYDMLVVPSWPTNGVAIPTDLSKSVLEFYRKNKRIVSFCSGAFLLAELGILEGCRATTHWKYAGKFKHRFKNIQFVDDVLYTYNGIVGCSAGSASAIDLSLEIIRQDFGYDVANQVARRLVVSAHRQGGQSQFVETPILEVPNHFSQTVDWVLSHLDRNINMNDLARRSNMSRRTFDRKFRSSFNLSPKEWLTKQRIEKAKALLEKNNHSIEQIAEMTGFDNAVTMRHHFRKQLSISPTQYRQQFGSRQ